MIIPLKIKRKDKARLSLVLLPYSLIYQGQPGRAVVPMSYSIIKLKSSKEIYS